MSYIALNDNTCLCVYPKVASTSIYSAAHELGLRHLDSKQALEFENRVAFLRDPIQRIQSVFNHFYYLRELGRKHQTIMPRGTIKGYGAVLKLGKAFDFRNWSYEDIAAYEHLLSKQEGTKEEIIKRFNYQDYERFIDFVLSVASDDHLIPQMLISRHKGEQVANKLYKFENINKVWKQYFETKLPHANQWPEIQKNNLYRIDELVHYFRLDYAARGKI